MLTSGNHRDVRRQSGASLIEVLVAIFVASMGILALAGLLGTSTRFGKTAEYRSMATLLAADLVDRMRANAIGASSYSLLSATLATSPADEVPCADPDNCTKEQLAARDLADWQASLNNSLPDGTGYVTQTDAANKMFDIWVIWRDPEALNQADLAANDDGRSACPKDFPDDVGARCMFFRVGL
ncbi:MAG TPA: type IV pilus modification protein PilV [Ideonella sp.]|uniref:type IV pilus modification protein PilV n=1 Tax=Ideonella sp. TaxID=1929293 RepID=UPI002BE87749|nr:type IV pilus modification protein PilV [Ideonella sp.]HSI49258.1 type IV pilus modification protein PilV [Ideonella sp.]